MTTASIEFRIIECHYSDELAVIVQELLRDGWRLAGNAYATVIDDKEWHYQPVMNGAAYDNSK